MKHDLRAFTGTASPGESDIAAIVESYDAGKPLPADSLRRIVDALRVFVADGAVDSKLQRFARKAGLRTKRGRHVPTLAETEPAFEAASLVIDRTDELETAGKSVRAARAQAIREVAARTKRQRRTVQNDVRLYGGQARRIRDFVAELREPERRIRAAVALIKKRSRRQFKK